VTDPRGCCFVSYRRIRASEVGELARRLRVRGIPLWVDISDLGSGSTEEQIRQALESDGCSCALVWVTPEVEQSAVIRRVEVPGIVRRAQSRDGFFAVFVAAGGLDYEGAARVAIENPGTTDLRSWNQRRVDSDPAASSELDALAELVLSERLSAGVARLRDGDPMRVGLWVRRAPPTNANGHLELDWSDSFAGRRANLGAWESELLPALSIVHRTLGRRAGGRAIIGHGHPTLAAAVALGRAFPAVANIPLSWEQVSHDGSRSEWSLAVHAEPSGYDVRTSGIDVSGEGLAVLVSVMHDAGPAFGATTGLPSMRTSIEIFPSVGRPRRPLTAAGAAQLASEVALAIREARSEYIGIKEIHLFLAAPVGLAVMLGQLLNALGPITVYEHVDDDAVGWYRPEVRLLPGSGQLV